MVKKTIFPAVLAGMAIGLGGTIFLSVENNIVGAFLFSLGLLTILTFGFNLFTGKVGYLLDNPPSYLGTLGIIWVGNFIGTGIFALILRFTKVYEALYSRSVTVVTGKVDDTAISVFLLAVGCGFCMYIAVNSYKTCESFQKVIMVVLPVMVFIIAKFEHCIANMFYFWIYWLGGGFTSGWLVKSVVYIIIMSLGNSVGAFIIPGFMKLCK